MTQVVEIVYIMHTINYPSITQRRFDLGSTRSTPLKTAAAVWAARAIPMGQP